MTSVLEQVDLDYLALQPCSLPDCDRHPGRAWFNPDCHPCAAVFLTSCRQTGQYVVRCGQCLAEFARLTPEHAYLRGKFEMRRFSSDPNMPEALALTAPCHREGWLVMSYGFGDGALKVFCAVCHAGLGRIDLPGH